MKETDLPLVNRAQQELGVSISSLFIECLAKRLAAHETALQVQNTGLEKISLLVRDGNSTEDPVVVRSFWGRWLVKDWLDPTLVETRYSVAETRKGKLVVCVQKIYTSDVPYNTPRDRCPSERYMYVHETFQSFREDGYTNYVNRTEHYPDYLVARVGAILGDPVEIEMDI